MFVFIANDHVKLLVSAYTAAVYEIWKTSMQGSQIFSGTDVYEILKNLKVSGGIRVRIPQKLDVVAFWSKNLDVVVFQSWNLDILAFCPLKKCLGIMSWLTCQCCGVLVSENRCHSFLVLGSWCCAFLVLRSWCCSWCFSTASFENHAKVISIIFQF